MSEHELSNDFLLLVVLYLLLLPLPPLLGLLSPLILAGTFVAAVLAYQEVPK